MSCCYLLLLLFHIMRSKTPFKTNHIQLETIQIGAFERGIQIGASIQIGALREANTRIKDPLRFTFQNIGIAEYGGIAI